ncbi:polymorphic toxin-type HINT domain-containing protein [Kitasatospora sp. NPDC058218]|uniref:polymorphic toxin-type HINT domain-containing protein n=1 Tax=Kitasatospora sp. NPDC058218 TaxID=3346385 RepID=UPI0036D7A4F2
MCLVLLAALVPVLTAGESTATPTADPPVASLAALASGTPVPEPLRPSAAYPAGLNARIASFGQQIGTLPQRVSELAAETQKITQGTAAIKASSDAVGKDTTAIASRIAALNAKSTALSSRIAAHNAAPHVFQLPAEAAAASAYDAEKARLDAEAAQLQTERAALESESSQANAKRAQLATDLAKLSADTLAYSTKATALFSEAQGLVSQRQQMLQQMATANQSLIDAPPPAGASSMARGVDAARPPNLTTRGTGVSSEGGDHRSPAGKNAAIDAYAAKNGVKVDKRPVTAYLSPAAVNRLPASDLARLVPVARYDGLVPKPNGHYKALEVWDTSGAPGPGQEAFDSALAKGGQATVADGGKKIIDEVESVSSCDAPNSFAAGTPVLLADGSSLPIERITPGTQVRATDPTTWDTAPHAVTAAIRHAGPHTMVDVTIADGATLHATDGHPFWEAGTGTFTDAADLGPGDELRRPDGTTVGIIATRAYPQDLVAYNLTVSDVHTYYVLAGATPVLVHNCVAITPEARQHVLEGVVTDDNKFAGWHLHPDQTGGIPEDRFINGTLVTNADGTVTVDGTVGARLPGGEILPKVANVGHTFFPPSWTAEDVMAAGQHLFDYGVYKRKGTMVTGDYHGVRMTGFLQKTANGTYAPSTFFPEGK